MDAFERQVRAIAIHTLRDTRAAPSAAAIGELLHVDASRVSAALRALAAAHRLVLVPGTDAVMMAHPFSGVASDFLVTIGARRWFANCVWDGLSILALLGDGTLETHSPWSGSSGRCCRRGADPHLIPEDLAAFEATHHHVVEDAGGIEARLTRHERSLVQFVYRMCECPQ